MFTTFGWVVIFTHVEKLDSKCVNTQCVIKIGCNHLGVGSQDLEKMKKIPAQEAKGGSKDKLTRVHLATIHKSIFLSTTSFRLFSGANDLFRKSAHIIIQG